MIVFLGTLIYQHRLRRMIEDQSLHGKDFLNVIFIKNYESKGTMDDKDSSHEVSLAIDSKVTTESALERTYT